MKNFLILLVLLILFTITGCKKNELSIAQPIVVSTVQLSPNTLSLVADTTVSGVWDGGGKVLRINDYRVHGKGTMQNFIIDAALTQWIFDTSINLKNIQAYNDVFSTAWYGINANNADNWWNIQKSINVCRDNHLECNTTGRGVYRYSKTLEVSSLVNNAYQQCQVHFSGDASYWDNGQGTTFQYTGTTGPAFNLQLNKGSILDHVVFNGLWKSPGGVDSVYFNITEANYKDQSGKNLPDSYAGVTIDFRTSPNGSRSGSSGIYMNNISIGGFAKALSFSQNGYTQNDDANSIDYIHFFDNKYCIVTGQPQEKGISINHVYSWGSVYNVLLHKGGGNYSFNVANIAGRCIEPIQASIGHWFSSSIKNWYCENIGRVITISAQMPFTLEDCNFDLNIFYSKSRIVLNSNSIFVTFHGCTIRYYDGLINNIYVHGAVTLPPPPDNYFGGGSVLYK